MYSGLVRVVNEVGSWEGPYTSLDVIDEAGSNFTSSITGWLTGAGGYEGLSAYLVYELGSGTFRATSPPKVRLPRRRARLSRSEARS